MGGDSGERDGQREEQKFHSPNTEMREATDDKHQKTPRVALKAGIKAG